MRRSFPLALFVLMAAIDPGWALATCTATISDVNFGHVDLLPGAPVSTTASVTISCDGIDATGVRICPYIGKGSGGEDSTARYMTSPSGTLSYQLYRSAGPPLVWGDPRLGLGSADTIDFSGPLIGTKSASTTLTLNAQILASQNLPADTYSSIFAASEVDFIYGPNVLGLVACDAVPLLTSHIHPTFQVSAIVDKNCTVSSSPVNFGTRGVLSSAVTANGQVSVRCTLSTPYTVGLDNGISGTGPTARVMKFGSRSIAYGLYQDAGYLNAWSNAGGGLVGGNGTGSAQAYTVFGRAPAQTTPPPGTYSDTVVITVTY